MHGAHYLHRLPPTACGAGINHKPLAPMGSGRGLHMEPPPLSASSPTAAMPGAPGTGHPGAAGGFPGAPGMPGAPRGPIVMDPRTGQPVMLVPVPVAPGGGQPGMMPPAGMAGGMGAGMGGLGMSPPRQQPQQPDLSSFIGAPAAPQQQQQQQQQGGASGGKDPFADLFK